MSHATNFATLRKAEDYSTYPATRNVVFRSETSCEEWMLHAQFCPQLALPTALCCKLQHEKNCVVQQHLKLRIFLVLLLQLWMMKGQIHQDQNNMDNARESYKQGVSLGFDLLVFNEKFNRYPISLL